MGISDLYIFSKDTDANASLRGYNYQVLKTVETWVDNFLNKIDDEIYCDFEEDIFQINPTLKTARFRQIKLYSNNFSFASKEVKKCIAHFFMLHVKTDYTLLEKEFVFEANTSVAQKKGKNDAELLKKWSDNQENLDDELLKKCVAKVRSIVSVYIEEQAKAIGYKTTTEEKETINEALGVLKSLEENDWIEFTKRVKWRFNNVSSDEEFLTIRNKIEEQILRLPFDIDKKNISSIFGMLNTIAWDKASSENTEGRKLTSDELKETLLQSANDSDKWYWQVAERWKGGTAIPGFTIGEFYEVIDATRHCRQHPYLTMHDHLWLNLLKIYIDNVEMDDVFKRKAIYEYLWLRFRPTDYYTEPEGDLLGEVKYFEFYFRNFKAFKNATEIEDAQSLMNISVAAIQIDKTDLKKEQVEGWFYKMEETIKAKLEKETNPNEICHLLENLGTHYLFLNARKKGSMDASEVITPFKKIFAHINKADLYDVTALSTRLNEYIKLLIEVDPDKNAVLIEVIENFTEELNPLVEKRNGSYKLAKVEIERGMRYLKSTNPIHLLKALNSFHKAKTLWYRQESIEGFVLALMNVSQLYSAIGLNLAAKYYAMGAAWASIHNGSHHLLKRIADAFGLVFYANFKQGAWMNAIISFADYMNARDEFKGTPLDPTTDKMPFKVMADLAIILHATPLISPQLKVLIDAHIKLLDELGAEYIKPAIFNLEKKFPTDTSLKDILERNLTDRPLNDVGKKRIIRFNALGSLWEISFANDYKTTPIAEEFCGIMQVMLAEISLSKYDFHLVKGSVKIELEINPDYKAPEQLPSHMEFKWKVFLEPFDSAVSSEIKMHTAKSSTKLMYILEEISLLPKEEFREKFQTLFIENDLAGKTLVLGSYQRMYRTVFMRPRFDSLQRQNFAEVDTSFLNLPVINSIIKWNEKLSSKYNQEEAIENIKHRFKNSNRCIYITIEKLKQDKDFPSLVNELRSEGFLDWQITLAIMNFMLNYKTQLEIDKQNFETEEQHHEAYNEQFHKLLRTDEKDCYVEFPLAAFHSEEFKFQLNHTLVIILESYGLENNANFPNFKALKEFLDVRFNMQNDNSDDGNLLHDIKKKSQ
ncbi:MAG: hypothetical protein H3C64_01320 [Candidatus Kuenenia stuttgartiensis]|nr:hypothetical protein [Candidatus Kuenenia stuttgartiensis]